MYRTITGQVTCSSHRTLVNRVHGCNRLGLVVFSNHWMNHSTLLYRYSPTYQWQKLAEEMETHYYDQHNDTRYHSKYNIDTIY